MFEHTRILARQFGRHLLLCHLLLAGFAPFLHAHSAEPVIHEAGFHAFFDLPAQRLGICPWSGEPTSPLTVELGEFRSNKPADPDGLACETATEALDRNASAGFDPVDPAFVQAQPSAQSTNAPCGAAQPKSGHPPSPQAP